MTERVITPENCRDTVLSAASRRTLAESDNMPPELRQCVHEYGSAIVTACLQVKVRDPRQIRNLVREIWAGARQTSGQRTPKRGTLDWLLLQAGASISAATLARILYQHSLAIVPLEPTAAMIEASKAEVAGFDLKITKSEKHRRRLRAANEAGFAQLWQKAGPAA